MVANALVSSCLDYCNSQFRSFSSKNITRLQNIQNCLARFVSGASRFSHVSPILKFLHWLPVKQRIIFKTLLFIYKFLSIGEPKYFAPYLSLLYPQTKVGDILDSGPSRRRRRRRNFLVDAITQKQINIFFSNLVHMLRVPKGRSLF